MASVSLSIVCLVVTLTCCFVLLAHSSKHNTRAAGLVGAPEQMPSDELNDKYVLKAAHFAVEHLNKESGTKHGLVKVLRGTSQVVAGVRYQLVLAIGEREHCYENTPQHCPIKKHSIKEWHVDVWAKPTNPPQYELLNIKEG